MLNAQMRRYDYYRYETDADYATQRLSDDVQGTVLMAINTISQGIQNSILYEGATYIGITHTAIDASYVIQYGEQKLKVLYVNNNGRYKLVYMANI